MQMFQIIALTYILINKNDFIFAAESLEQQINLFHIIVVLSLFCFSFCLFRAALYTPIAPLCRYALSFHSLATV